MAIRRPRRRIIVVPLVGLMLLNACADQAGAPRDETFDGHWILAEGSGPDGTIDLDVGLEDPAPVTLVVDGEDWSGVAACNAYSGTANVQDGTITGDLDLEHTEMACEPPELMVVEAAYLDALRAVEEGELTTATEAADALTLTGADTVLRFTRAPEGDPSSTDGEAVPGR